jgi:hypothetical protein
MATKCDSVASFPGAHFVATCGCSEIKDTGKKNMMLSCSLMHEEYDKLLISVCLQEEILRERKKN